MEQFNSMTQNSLFNVPEENVLEDRADSFLSGLSRAFTLSNGRHVVDRRRSNKYTVAPTSNRPVEKTVSTAYFTNAQGETFRVTVEKVEY